MASKWRVLIAEFEKLYQGMQVRPTFFQVWDTEEPAVVAKLKKRPLALSEIEITFSKFRVHLLKAM